MASNRMLAEVEKALAEARHTSVPLALPDVVVSASACLAAVLVGAIPGWIFLSGQTILYIGLIVALMIAGIAIARRSPVSAPLALGYSLVLGLMVGAFTHSAVTYGGTMALISQAVIGTLAGAVGVLALYATPFGRRVSRMTGLLMAITIGYAILGLVSFGAALIFGTGGGWGFYGVEGIGLALCLLGVALAAWSLLADVGNVDAALAHGADRTWQWSFGMSIASSLVWMYMEILRFLSIANR